MDRRAEKGEAPGTCIAVYCTIPLRQRWTLELPPGGVTIQQVDQALLRIAWVDPVIRLLFWAITGCHLPAGLVPRPISGGLPTPEYQYTQAIQITH